MVGKTRKDASWETDKPVFVGKTEQVKQHESYGLVSIILSGRTTHSCPNFFSLCLVRKGHKEEKRVSHGKLPFHSSTKKEIRLRISESLRVQKFDSDNWSGKGLLPHHHHRLGCTYTLNVAQSRVNGWNEPSSLRVAAESPTKRRNGA